MRLRWFKKNTPYGTYTSVRNAKIAGSNPAKSIFFYKKIIKFFFSFI